MALGKPDPVGRLRTALLAERHRWWLWTPVGLGLGIAGYFLLPSEPPLWLGAAGLLGLLPLGLLAQRQGALLVPWLAALLVCAGFTAAQVRTETVAAPVLEREIGPVRLTGQVARIEPKGEGRGPRVILQALQFERPPRGGLPERVRIRLTARDPAAVAPGDWISLPAKLSPPPMPAAPGAFDFARQAYFQRLGGVGYAVGHLQKQDPGSLAVGQQEADVIGAWRLDLDALRARITQRIRAALPGTAGAVAAALITGERAAIPAEVIEDMRRSGLAHLLAISGLHIGLVTAILFFGLRAILALVPGLALHAPIKKWAALVAGLGAFAYLLLSGATIPTQRAFIMVLIVLTGVLLDRTAISLRLVAWAAVLILLLAPESLLSASFQLSFAATTALVAAYEALRERRDLKALEAPGALDRLWLYVAGVAFSSVIAICATAPFAIYHFNRFALFGLVANLLAVPLTAFWIMPTAVVGLLLMPFGLEHLALLPMGWGLELLVAWAGMVASWPYASLPLPAMPSLGLALITAGGLWLCLWAGRWRAIGLLPILLGLLSIAVNPTPDLLVDREARLFALRDSRGQLWLSNKRRERFTADIWLRRNGQDEAGRLARNGLQETEGIGCDALGCIARFGERTLAVVEHGRALLEDCGRADVVVSLVAVPRGRCAGPELVIDRWRLWHGGSQALWLRGDAVVLESVARERGARPWTPAGRRPDVE